ARRWSFALAGAAALGLAATAVIALRRADEAPLAFETGAGAGSVGDVLQAAPAASLPVRFGEGSRLLLHRGARARVLEARPRGARVLLESGALDVAIVHRAQTRWLFEAGPFRVLVKGTEFELGWEPAQQQLSLHMKSGTVELSGACLGASRLVERGASVRLSCPQPSAAVDARAQSASAP